MRTSSRRNQPSACLSPSGLSIPPCRASAKKLSRHPPSSAFRDFFSIVWVQLVKRYGTTRLSAALVRGCAVLLLRPIVNSFKDQSLKLLRLPFSLLGGSPCCPLNPAAAAVCLFSRDAGRHRRLVPPVRGHFRSDLLAPQLQMTSPRARRVPQCESKEGREEARKDGRKEGRQDADMEGWKPSRTKR